jgi:predicted nucleic acid-binding protein
VTTLRPQGRHALDCVTAACAAALHDQRPVSLLPQPASADDPKDDKYVAAALGGGAGFVVTLDRRHMLGLGAYQGVRFVTPGDFLAVLRLSTS